LSGNALLRAKAALVKREELELQIRSLLFSFDERELVGDEALLEKLKHAAPRVE